jgi:hypothetical protein
MPKKRKKQKKMWDKENNSAYMEYVNSYLKYGTSQMQNMGIDVEAKLLHILGKERWGDILVMTETKEDRRKYLLIRR